MPPLNAILKSNLFFEVLLKKLLNESIISDRITADLFFTLCGLSKVHKSKVSFIKK